MPELFTSHASVLRNKGIAQVLYDIGWIERWGGGIQKMRTASADAGIPEPVFQEDQVFSVISGKMCSTGIISYGRDYRSDRYPRFFL